MLDLGGLDQHVAVEIDERPLGTRLGAIDRDDSAMHRPDLGEYTVRELVNGTPIVVGEKMFVATSGHLWCLVLPGQHAIRN
jgi:hypothetical protein